MMVSKEEPVQSTFSQFDLLEIAAKAWYSDATMQKASCLAFPWKQKALVPVSLPESLKLVHLKHDIWHGLNHQPGNC